MGRLGAIGGRKSRLGAIGRRRDRRGRSSGLHCVRRWFWVRFSLIFYGISCDLRLFGVLGLLVMLNGLKHVGFR